MTSLGARLYRRLPDGTRRRVPVEVRADLRARLGEWAPGDLGFEPEPPRVAPGERTGPPDVLVLGPWESGARWLLSLLHDHPDVAPTRDPDGEAHLLDRGCTEPFGASGVARFHRYFPRRPGRIIGHWSADALSYPWMVPLLAEAAPRARVLVVVRHPVDLVVDRVAATADTRAPHVGSNLADAVDRGYQGAALARLLDRFDARSVRVVPFERCAADPAAELAAVFRFLDVAVPDEPPLPHAAPGVTARPSGALEPGVRARLRDLYADDVAVLAGLVPDLDPARWWTRSGGAGPADG